MLTQENVMKLIHLLILPVVGLALSAVTAGTQTWPAKPLRAMVPIAAGSSTDIITRMVFEKLSVQLGQPSVVENRSGAGGTTSTAFVARSEPDGYTLLATGSVHTISQSVYSKLTCGPARDFAAVVPPGISPNVLVVAPGKDFRTVGDLVAAGKARPGALNFFVGRYWHGNPSERRAVPGKCGNKGSAYSVQRRR